MLNPTYTADVKLAIELLKHLIDRADADTWLTLEGNLYQFYEQGLAGVVREVIPSVDTDVLGYDYGRVAIPLTPDNAQQVKTAILPRVGIRTLICHIFLERNGRCLFAACDHCKNGAAFSDWVTREFLEQLENIGVIRLHRIPPKKVYYETIYPAHQPHGGYSFGKYRH